MIGQTKFRGQADDADDADDAAAARLVDGFEGIVHEFGVRDDFPQEVLAEVALSTSPGALVSLLDDPLRIDLTHLGFVTLDPASSTDLDQAFCIEMAPDQQTLILHYAIADVGAFVARGSALEHEAWSRGETIYAPHRRIPLYPPTLCEGAGSLLPGSRKPAIELLVEQSPDGGVLFRSARRCVIQSQAKLAYETVEVSSVPFLEEFARRSELAEQRRGAMRSDLPEQELKATKDGHFELELRSLLPSETANAALSLSANIAAATFLAELEVGLFRVMQLPDEAATASLHRLARALKLTWHSNTSLGEFQRSLRADLPRDRAFLVAARRAGGGASYATKGCDPTTDVEKPFHAAIAAQYLHATAPLRRLADRYVLDLLCDLTPLADPAKSAPTATRKTLAALPAVMRASGSQAAKIERAAVDLAECILLERSVGSTFVGTVLESGDTGAVVQIADPPVRARLNRSATTHGAVAGAVIEVQLVGVDVVKRSLSFSVNEAAPATEEPDDKPATEPATEPST